MQRRGKHSWIKGDVHTTAWQFLLPVLKNAQENENIAGPRRQTTSRKETCPMESVQHHALTGFKQLRKLCLLWLVSPLQLRLPDCLSSILMQKLNHFQEQLNSCFTSHWNIWALVLSDTAYWTLGMVNPAEEQTGSIRRQELKIPSAKPAQTHLVTASYFLSKSSSLES